MSDPKPRKTPARKTTRSRSGAQAGLDGTNAASTPNEGAATASTPSASRSNELGHTEEPVLAIQQVSAADTTADSQSDISYSSDAADGADGADGLDGEIRRRAYELYLARGGAEGNDLQDWLEAERAVRSGSARSEQSM